ncbi:MAG: hypothetical protein ACSHWN_06220 [Methylophilaceae bacterium]
MKNVITIGLSIFILSGCGAEIAYKRGATGRDFQSEKAACQKATSEQALNQCLEENGWAIQKLDGSTFSDDELFATASVTDDNRVTAQKEKPTPIIQTTESLKEEALVKPEEIKPDEKKAIAKQATADEAPAQSAAVTKPQPSIFDTYVIKSWWKMGGTPKQLDQNMAECNQQLGEAHTPNKQTFTYTRGFAICMRQKGWRGLIER